MKKLEERRQLVRLVTRENSAPFYRHLYGSSGPKEITNEEEWRALPFVTKDALLAEPLKNRMFASNAETDHLRASSGTSGKPPLFSPRTYLRGFDFRLEYHDFKQPMLSYLIPTMPHWNEHFQASLGVVPCVVVYDPKYPAASLHLAHAVGVDSISTFAFHMGTIGAEMEKMHMGPNIRYIELGGEAVTKTLFEYMRSVFPNASIVQTYGSSEVEDHPMGIPCRAMDGTEPLAIYHQKSSQYHELIDPETGIVVAPRKNAEGELVITAYPGEPCAFPLLRYRTGDMVRVVEESCPKHGTWAFMILGRVAMDFLKIAGGVLRADEAARVIRLFDRSLTDRFEMHRYERVTSSGPRVQVEMHVEMKKATDLDRLANDIAMNLRVNPTRTYAQGVSDGMYLPLTCVELKPANGKKTKRLVAH